jgi:hypothetical protein
LKRLKVPTGAKHLAGLVALMLCVCAAGIAESGTIFPWREYTLDVTLVTCDATLVDVSPAPSVGTLALVELTSLGQDIALVDIEKNISEFSLRDGDDTEYAPYSWRVRGVAFANGIFATNPQQKTLELIYLLEGKDASAFEGAKLVIATDNKDERVVVTLSKAPSVRKTESTGAETPAATAEPADTVTDAPEAPATGEQPRETAAVESTEQINAQLNTLLGECAASAKNAWQKAIFEAGVQELQIDGATVTFLLRSFNPQLKSLGDYTSGQANYLLRMMRNVAAYDLSAQLTLENESFTKKSVAAFKNTVAKAASTSVKAFADKRVRIAITDWLFPAPAKTVKKAEDMLTTTEPFRRLVKQITFETYSDTYREFAPLFYGQTKQTLDTKGGPYALLLKCVSINPEALLETARQKTLAALSRKANANVSSEEEIENAFLSELAANALSMRKKASEKFTLTLNVDVMAQERMEEDYTDYINRYQYKNALNVLMGQVAVLPDYPALDFPSSGRLSGSTKGTKIILKAPDDGVGRYIQLRDYNTHALAVTAFIRPGKSCTVYTPQGNYYFLIASGETWYGEEVMFGNSGNYSRTELFMVFSKSFYHTVTLVAVSEGNLSIYNEDSSTFHQ